MRRSLLFGLLSTSLILQAGAQRGGGGHMGGIGHASPSFSAPHSFAWPGRSPLMSPASRWPSGNPNRRPSSPYRWNGVGYRGPYLYAGYPGLIGYGFPLAYGAYGDYGDDQEDSVAPQPADYYAPEPPAPQVAEYAPEYAPEPFRPAYQPGQVEFAPVHAQPITTLVFKDGRPPVEVHNYALTANTLYGLDGDARQEIPLSLLDIPATVETNRQAGVDFALPVSH